MTNFNYDLFKVRKMTEFDYDLFKVSKMTEFSIHGECLILHVNQVVSVVTLPAKKKESQKGYIEMN